MNKRIYEKPIMRMAILVLSGSMLLGGCHRGATDTTANNCVEPGLSEAPHVSESSVCDECECDRVEQVGGTESGSHTEYECEAKVAEEMTAETLDTAQRKLNYAVGYDVGRSIARNKLEYNRAIFERAVRDGIEEEEHPELALLNDAERIDAKRSHSEIARKVRDQEREIVGRENKKLGDLFLAKNKNRRGVVTTESGLQYEIIQEGRGVKPTLEQRVKVHYVGTLVDGSEFDNSYLREQPATFPVGRVVKGWTEALQLMRVGARWKIVVPSELGYGERGAGGKIGPHAVLVFEIELLGIEEE